jgi:uncharacterized protein (TIGR03086 family)
LIEGAEMAQLVRDHLQACDGFTNIASAAKRAWAAPSPCIEWDARGILEHVIGFHDVLLLRPLNAKPTRPKNDPNARWRLTVDALSLVLSRPDVLTAERESLLGYLTTEVLIHTWDLAKAAGVALTLDSRLCQIGLDRAMANPSQFEGSGMFGPPIPVPEDAALQERLVGLFGRDPDWCPTPDCN